MTCGDGGDGELRMLVMLGVAMVMADIGDDGGACDDDDGGDGGGGGEGE